MTRYCLIAILALFLFGCGTLGGKPEEVARTEFEKWAKTNGMPYQNVEVILYSDAGTVTLVRVTAEFRDSQTKLWIKQYAITRCDKQWIEWQCNQSFSFLQVSPIEREIGGVTMVLVPGGKFQMGSSQVEGHDPHKVYLDSFWIDKYEVTNAQYKKCVDSGSCKTPVYTAFYGNPTFDNYPVIYVRWSDATRFCGWASKRLPTEADWEKAARGTDGRNFPWDGGLDDAKVNSYFYSNSKRPSGLAPVGSYPLGASPYGAMDMAGNVREWISDFHDYYEQKYPRGGAWSSYKLTRGGSFDHGGISLYVFYRTMSPDITYSQDIGFRCAQ